MNRPPTNTAKPAARTGAGLLQSGVIFSAANFLTLLIGYGFQTIVSRHLGGTSGDYGLVLTTITFIGFMGLPLSIATQAVTHYIARFHFSGDDARLHGLLAGCRKFLFHITIAGSLIAIVLVKPLGDYFHIPRASLTFVALVCVLANLWGSYMTVICQGLGWFKRLALVGLLAAVFRILFGGLTTRIWHTAEWAVAASTFMVLANLVLFFWKKDFPRRTQGAVAPWNSEFIQFLVVSAACVGGGWFFSQGDQLVANKNLFSKAEMDAYSSAGLFARALPAVAGPLLAVLFTHRSGSREEHGDDLREQLKLLGLYAFSLVSGAIALFLLKGFCLEILHRNTPEAAAMIGRFAATMVFTGLLQALALWALASRWTKIALLYGALGLGYWLTLLVLGKSPAELLQTMPVAAGAAFVILFSVWLVAMRRHKSAAKLV
jgi:hypothetical protein